MVPEICQMLCYLLLIHIKITHLLLLLNFLYQRPLLSSLTCIIVWPPLAPFLNSTILN